MEGETIKEKLAVLLVDHSLVYTRQRRCYRQPCDMSNLLDKQDEPLESPSQFNCKT